MQIHNFKYFNMVGVENIEEPEKYLKHGAEILNKLGVKWYLGFGTALGFYRDKDFIPQDTDVDFCVVDVEDTDELIEAFEGHYELIRVAIDDRHMQAAFQAKDDFILDVCFFHSKDDKYYAHAEGGTFEDRKDVIGELQMIDTKYGRLPFPEKMEEYLESRYGDWKTPKHGAISSSLKV